MGYAVLSLSRGGSDFDRLHFLAEDRTEIEVRPDGSVRIEDADGWLIGMYLLHWDEEDERLILANASEESETPSEDLWQEFLASLWPDARRELRRVADRASAALSAVFAARYGATAP